MSCFRPSLVLALVLLALPAPAQEPAPEPAPRDVTVGFFLVDVHAFHDAERTVEVDFGVQLEWHDPTQVGRFLEPRLLDPHELWTPELDVVNQRTLSRRRTEAIRVLPDGTCIYLQRYFGELSAPIDLSDFPFDRHELLIDLASTAPGRVRMHPKPGLVGQAEVFSLPDWTVGPGGGAPHVTDVMGLQFDGFRYRFSIDRRRGYYVWNVLVPLSLVVFMAWVALWIDPLHAAPHIGVASTSMLAMIAYRFALGQHVPQLPYLTRLDQFLLGSTALVFLALSTTIASTRRAARVDPEAGRKVDRVARVVFPLLFLGVLLKSVWL